MKNKKTNLFTISTPSQMMNALEFISYYKIQNENNIVVVSSASDAFYLQILKIGAGFNLISHKVFTAKHSIIKQAAYNKMPLKLWRLRVSKLNIKQIIDSESFDRLVLGNYANFISQYCTQLLKVPTFVLDDGNGSILRAVKREREINEKTPFFEFNRKKNGLWLVKLVMGFYKYKIPQQLIFFSSYTFSLVAEDTIVHNNYSYLKSLFRGQQLDHELVYFIGSPISEVGYITEEAELEMIINTLASYNKSKMVYISHRLDSKYKLNELKKSVEVLSYDLPIEFALTQNIDLPSNIGGFFTSALFNLAEVVASDVLFYSVKIPDNLFLKENMKNTATKVYEEYSKTNRIEVKEYNPNA